jgi:tetratricopeptide (TPR) repeat protein
MGNEAILLKRKKLKAIQALQSNDLRKARKLLREVCKSDPRDPQAWLLLSSVNGRAGNFEGVIECCQRALLLDGRISQAYSNLGNAHVSLGRHDEAMAAYRKALALSPKEPTILHNLGSALQKMGRIDEAIEYFRQSVSLQPNYAGAHYGLANALHERWRFKEAIPHYQHALRIDPRMRDARIGLARTLNNRGDLHLAEVCLRDALEIHTDDLELHLELATTLRYQGRFEDALAVLDKALEIDPKHPGVIAAQADLFERKSDYDKAYALVRKSSAAGEWTTTAADVLIRLCRRLGCCEEAVEIARRLLAMDSLQVGSRQQLHYSLGRLYDKLGDFDKAFAECKQANDLSGLTFDPIEHTERVDELIAGFNAEAMASMPRAALRSQQPILIIGMPRSGTSLVEQIVASHPEVFGAGELNEIGELVRSLPTGLFPHRMGSVGREVVDDLARRYLARLGELGAGATRVTDKLPGNFLYLGLIAVMLPDARVIHCVRDPLDTCLSIYLQGFSNGHPYATDLTNIAAYYNDYLRLMEHWKGVLDIRMLAVDYRGLVTDQERVSREMIAFCGLAWDDRCRRFHETERAVATASYDQVRKPVYTRSLDRWKNYEQHIGPLREALARGREPSARRVVRSQSSRDEEDAEPSDRVTGQRRGNVLLHTGRIEEAIDDLRRVIGRNPNDAEGHCELASALEMQGQVKEAISHYDQARRIEPRSRRASLQLGRLLGGMGRFAEAEACYRQALIYTPDGPRLHYGLADALRYEGRYDDALAVLNHVLQRQPADAVAMAGIADLYERKGEYAEAYAWVRRVIDAEAPSAAAADVMLRLCRTYDCCDEAVALANRLLTRGSLSQDGRRRLHFALGRYYDKAGRFDAAFAEFQQANDLLVHRFDCDKHIEQVDGLIGGFSMEALAKMPRASVRSERPIFIVGMTRSGTSLVEQVLASHRQVFGGGELHEINEIVQSLPATLYPLCMDSVSQEIVDAIAKRYLGRLDELSGQAARVTDKMPGNFQNLGLIAITLPGARVIRCLRDPLDTCLSTYFQDFGPSHPYASDLRNIAVFYKEYERLMAHWKEVLDIAMLEVHYSDLVTDQERVSREMIAFCGLEWDDRCLLFHETKRSVATASYQQVRRPMYKSSLARWKNYEAHIGPLRDALGLVE